MPNGQGIRKVVTLVLAALANPLRPQPAAHHRMLAVEVHHRLLDGRLVGVSLPGGGFLDLGWGIGQHLDSLTLGRQHDHPVHPGKVQARLVSRFNKSDLIAYGQNGTKWRAVSEIQPAEYFLLSTTGKAYPVSLPHLVVAVSNYGWPYFYWTPDRTITLRTMLYPLLIGNTYTSGNVCLGSTGLRCKVLSDIPTFVKQVIEAPASGHGVTDTDALYSTLSAEGWDKSIGEKHGRSLQKLLAELSDVQ